MSREDHLRRAVFQAPKLDLLLSHFPLVRPFPEFQKMANLGHFAQFTRPLLCGHLLEPPFAAKGCSIIELLAYINEQRRPFAPSCFSSP